MLHSTRESRTLVKYLIPILIICIPMGAFAIGPKTYPVADQAYTDYIYYNEDNTPVFQNACVYQYQTKNASTTEIEYTHRAMNKISQVTGVPVQYMGNTDIYIPPLNTWMQWGSDTDQYKIFPYPYMIFYYDSPFSTYNSSGTKNGAAAVPLLAYKNPNSDFGKQEVYREQQKHFVLRGGVAQFTDAIDSRPYAKNTVLHEAMHFFNLNDAYTTNTMMGMQALDANGDFTPKDLDLLTKAGQYSRDPNTCFITETMDMSKRPDVKRTYTPTKPISMPTGKYVCGTSGCKWVPNDPSNPPVTTTTTTKPPVTTTIPPVTTTKPPVTTTKPPVTTTKPPVTTTIPPVTTTKPPVTTTIPPAPTGEGLKVSTKIVPLPTKTGDISTFTFTITNLGINKVNSIELSSKILNPVAPHVFAKSLTTLNPGKTLLISYQYKWTGKENLLSKDNDVKVTGTPILDTSGMARHTVTATDQLDIVDSSDQPTEKPQNENTQPPAGSSVGPISEHDHNHTETDVHVAGKTETSNLSEPKGITAVAGELPFTGSSTQMLFWVAMSLISAGLIAIASSFDKKKQIKREDFSA